MILYLGILTPEDTCLLGRGWIPTPPPPYDKFYLLL